MIARVLVTALQVATCIGCACTDERACAGGCHWERVDRAAQLGVCSGCTEHVARWDEGVRKLAPTAHRRLYNRKYYAEHGSSWRGKYATNRKAKRANRT